MVRTVVQVVCVLAIAIGVGLLVGGRSVNPMIGTDDIGTLVQSLKWTENEVQFFFQMSAALNGVGAAFLTLGTLGLIVPWVNAQVFGDSGLEPAPKEPHRFVEESSTHR